MQRPPPAPPDLYSFEVEDGAPPDLNSIAVGECEPESAMVTAKARSCRTEDLSVAVTEIQIYGGTRSPICAIGADITTLANDNAEDGAVTKGKVVHANAEPVLHFTKDRVNQPPPKPPDLPSQADNATDLSKSGGGEDDEDVAITIGGSDVSYVDDGSESSAEVGASAKEKRRTLVTFARGEVAVETVMTTVRGCEMVRRAPSLVARPPPLLAAVLPWDRGKAVSSTVGGSGTAEDGFVTMAGGERKSVKSQAGGGRERSKGGHRGGCGGNEEEGKKYDEVLVKGVRCALGDACVGGFRCGAGRPWNGDSRSVKVVPFFFFTLGAPWKVADTRKVDAAIRVVAATMREKGMGATRFGLFLGLNQDFEAHIEKEKAGLLNWSSNYKNLASRGQLQFSTASKRKPKKKAKGEEMSLRTLAATNSNPSPSSLQRHAVATSSLTNKWLLLLKEAQAAKAEAQAQAKA
ncbi:hypothetical protein PIB30_045158 [Stylosanthes scabra]|uniref:Uncharacterized protein n=1 Tax=Stylosanthes scabra TaxID=79078 RepID=A0ABU6WFY8_9FABA|nr:hypothetical protein [Stylosanthes scabra]